MARRPSAAVVCVAAAALALAGLGATSLTAALIALPHEATLAAIRERKPVTAKVVGAAVAANDRAAMWFDGCRHRTNAVLALGVAGAVPSEMERRARDILVRCPTSTYNWMRLALARSAQGNAVGARAAWRASVLTSGYAPGLDLPRLELGLRLLAPDDDEHVALLGRQLRITAAENAYQVAMAARRTGTEAFVRDALSREPSRDAFERALGG